MLSLNGCTRLWELTIERLAEVDISSGNSLISNEETHGLLVLDDTHILQATKSQLRVIEYNFETKLFNIKTRDSINAEVIGKFGDKIICIVQNVVRAINWKKFDFWLNITQEDQKLQSASIFGNKMAILTNTDDCQVLKIVTSDLKVIWQSNQRELGYKSNLLFPSGSVTSGLYRSANDLSDELCKETQDALLKLNPD